MRQDLEVLSAVGDDKAESEAGTGISLSLVG